jgi:type IV pilus assembly protein PilB
VLVTGPTGSGKTTTLYAWLQHLNQAERKILTVEDPIESQLRGVNQVPVRPSVGLTFAAALRAMLRQAPNVIMVGEIRDRETAEIALQAALTGHFVCSSLHTNDAVGAATRLIDLGAQPYLVAAGLRGVVAQRLVRRVCGACAERFAPSVAAWRQLGGEGTPPSGVMFSRGRGCAACQGTGYHGRIGLFEVLEIDETLRALIHEGADPTALRAAAAAAGLRSLRVDGIRKVSAGLTTVDEVASLTLGDTD